MRQDNIEENIHFSFFFFLTAKFSLWIVNGTNEATILSCLQKDFNGRRIAHHWVDYSNQTVCAARKWSRGHTEVIKDKNHGLCSTSKLKMLKKWASLTEKICIIFLRQQLLWELRLYHLHQLQLHFIPLFKKEEKCWIKLKQKLVLA